MIRSSILRVVFVTLVAALGLDRAEAANRGIISIDWGANKTDTLGAYVAPMAASETAGVVPASNWNSYINNTQATPLTLMNSNGVATNAQVTWSAPRTWCYPDTTNTPDGHMKQAFLLSAGPGNNITTPSVTVSGIPYGKYEVYVYTDYYEGVYHDQNNVTSYTIGDKTLWVQNLMNLHYDGSFVESSALQDFGFATSVGNYVHFTSLSTSSFTLTTGVSDQLGRVNWRSAATNGIQIVEVPEPASLTLLALGAIGMLSRHRKSA